MLIAYLLAVLAFSTATANADWPAFRGDGSSVSGSMPPPVEWSVDDGRNVAWEADLPGRGVSGPIVVGQRVFVTASDGPNRERLHTLAFDSTSGEQLWARQMWATGRTNCHESSSVAAPTPASDGERVFSFYSSNDLVAFDLAGNVQWIRALTLDHPRVGNDVGMASSVAVSGEAVIVQAECQGDSFAIGVSRRTGETLWEIERPQEANWASPLVWVTADGTPAVWLQDGRSATLLHANTGDELARIEADCPTIVSPTPAGNATLLLATGGVSRFAAPFAQPVASLGKLNPGSPCPVVVGDQVLVINRGGILASGDLTTGELLWRKRLGGKFWATPVAAGNRLYCVNDQGEATVVDLSAKGKVLGTMSFGDDVLASPAISNGALYVRSDAHLWKIATPQQALSPPNRTRR